MRFCGLVAMLALLSAAPVWADDTLETPVQDVSAYNLAEIKTMLDDGNYAEAIGKLHHITRKDTQNADAFNLLGYALRHTGDMNGSMANYIKALEIEPAHVGALEYQGELFLLLHQPEQADANLAKLKNACPEGCDQLAKLDSAIASYKKGGLYKDAGY